MKLTLFLFILFFITGFWFTRKGQYFMVRIFWMGVWLVENVSVLSYISKRDKHINITS